MAAEEPVYHLLAADELSVLAGTEKTSSGRLFPPDLPLDDFDLIESRFDRCLFRTASLRSTDFFAIGVQGLQIRGDALRQLQVRATLAGCALFDLRQKKGCTFAFCDMKAVALDKCNFTTNLFERCNLYDLRAVECSFRGAATLRRVSSWREG